MNLFNIPATKCLFLEEAGSEASSGAGAPAQGVEERIAASLFGNDGAAGNSNAVDKVVNEDDESLPPEDDTKPKGTEPEDEVIDGDVTLASMLGLGDDQLEYDDQNNVVFNAIIDGESHKVPVSDLVKSYQLQGHVNNKSIALENDRKEFHATRDQAYGELTTRLQGLNQLIQLNEQTLLAEYNGIDWDSLRMTEPGEWAALQQQFNQRALQIQQVKDLAGQESQRLTQEQQQQQQKSLQDRAAGELQKMMADNPTWSDQTVMAKDIGEVGAFLRNQYGFTDQEIADNIDHRLMRMFKDAMAFHAGTKAITDKKIPANMPKFVKPGTGGGDRPSLQKARQVKETKQAIRKSGGSLDSVANALINRM